MFASEKAFVDWVGTMMDHAAGYNLLQMELGKDIEPKDVVLTISSLLLVDQRYEESQDAEQFKLDKNHFFVFAGEKDWIAGFCEMYNKERKRISFKQLLTSLYAEGNSTLRKLDVSISDTSASTSLTTPTYFVEGLTANGDDGSASFRHEGNNATNAVPQAVYLHQNDSSNSVQVCFTASGSGKTVELAGSAYVRGKDIAIYLKPGRDIDWKPPVSFDTDRVPALEARHQQALSFLSKLLESVRTKNAGFFRVVEEHAKRVAAASVAVVIDEAAECPQFIRALISRRPEFEEVAKEKLSELKVSSIVFSVAGTGASRGSIGSETEKWDPMVTSASQSHELVYELLRATKSTNIPSMEYLKRHAPVLHTLASYNARMASIVIHLMHVVVFNDAIKGTCSFLTDIESHLVSRAMDIFMKSNGLNSLKDDPQRSIMVGAQALAVHLFGKGIELTGDETEKEKMVMTMKYGIGSQFVDDAVPMRVLTSRYGLVTPESIPRGERRPFIPFTVDLAMQLMALHLLKLPEGRSLLQPGFARFEATSTQIVKGALAASSMLAEEFRPSVYEVLEKLGFDFCIPLKDRTVKEFSDYKLFQRFKAVQVERHALKATDTELPCPHTTYFQRNIMTTKNVKDTQEIHKEDATNGGIERDSAKYSQALFADKDMVVLLFNFVGDGKNSSLFPFATIAFGNSEYADGYVTFCGVFLDEQGAKKRAWFTVAIQAKDYGAGSSLNFRHIAENVKRCRSQALNNLFRDENNRLICVASQAAKMAGKPNTVNRDFMAFNVDKSKILGDLLSKLYEKRCKKNDAPSIAIGIEGVDTLAEVTERVDNMAVSPGSEELVLSKLQSAPTTGTRIEQVRAR